MYTQTFISPIVVRCGKHFDAVDMLMTFIINITWYLRMKQSKTSSFLFLSLTTYQFLWAARNCFDEVASFSALRSSSCIENKCTEFGALRYLISYVFCQSRLNFLIEICAFWWECAAHGKHIFHIILSFVLFYAYHLVPHCALKKWPWQN